MKTIYSNQYPELATVRHHRAGGFGGTVAVTASFVRLGRRGKHWTHGTAATAAALRPPQRQRRTTGEHKMMIEEESSGAAEEVTGARKSLEEYLS